MISDNIKSVTLRIAKCCEKSGKSASDVELIAVSKTATVSQMEEALASGICIFGENRVQDAVKKYSIIGDRAVWHLIGHLQTNKVKDAVRIFSLIHSVDSLRLASEIDKHAGKMGKTQDILIQVNTSGEQSKFGIDPKNAGELISRLESYRNINVKGLMTIAPEVDDPQEVRPYFKALRQLRDKLSELRFTNYDLRILSMGMTNDFEVAIEEGANMIRIGRAIFS